MIKGIDVVTCVYVNPATNQFWLLDYRSYDPDGAGKTKLDHVRDVLDHLVFHKQLPFQAVLMDTWYATKDLMAHIESLQTVYSCPLKDNRQVDDSGGTQPYQRVDTLAWSPEEQTTGKRIKLKGFPRNHHVHLFRVVASPRRTDWIITDDPAAE